MSAETMQQSLGAYLTSGWEFVDEPEFVEGEGYLCPDGGDSMDVNYWPADDETYVHGIGCDRCQTVYPLPAGDTGPFSSPGLEVVTVELRSGETREAKAIVEDGDE